MSKYELKPCPFCGRKEQTVSEIPPFEWDGHRGVTRYQVLCDGCGATQCSYLTPDAAEKNWNRRKADG